MDPLAVNMYIYLYIHTLYMEQLDGMHEISGSCSQILPQQSSTSGIQDTHIGNKKHRVRNL